MHRFALLCASALVMVASTNANASTLTPIQVPTDLLFGLFELRGGGAVRGLNDNGQFVGNFGERNWVIWGVPHAYIYNYMNSDPSNLLGSGWSSRSPEGYRLGTLGGSVRADPNFRYLDLVPTANSDFNDRFFEPNAINNAGVVVGRLSSNWLGWTPDTPIIFDTATRSLTSLSVPGAVSAIATDINSSGTVVGLFYDGTRNRGFQFKNGTYTIIEAPWEPGNTYIGGINDQGYVVGYTGQNYFNGIGSKVGFLWKNGVFSQFDAGAFLPTDINNKKQIVGVSGNPGSRQGFLYENGQGYSFGPFGTWAYSINNLGQIGGESGPGGFITSVNSIKGVNAVPEPASWAMLIAGFGLVGAVSRRRRQQVLAG